MAKNIKISVTLPVKPGKLYKAWLDSSKHSAFTGEYVEIQRSVGSTFSAGSGYIKGENKELLLNRKIVQSWRTTDYPLDAEDSQVEIHFEPVDDGTKMIIMQINVPEGDYSKYRKAWKDNYIVPMQRYFAEEAEAETKTKE